MCGCKDDELYVRFLQFGVFSPVNRLHSSNSDTFTKEPWAYGNGTGLIAAEYLRLRHRMIPFLYSASVEVTENGLALIEPMYYGWADELKAYQCPNQYLFGGQMIVAPVTARSEAEGMTRVQVWLPEGTWTDFFTGDEYTGGRGLTVVRWLEEMPVFLKEGGFFVLDDRKYTNDVENPNQLKVYVTNGNGRYTLHEEQDGTRVDTVFVSKAGEGVQSVTFSCDGVQPRCYRFVFSNILTGDVTVLADGAAYPSIVDDNGRLSVTLEGIQQNIQYEITVRYEEQSDEKKKEALQKTITKLQMDNNEKNTFYEKLLSADHIDEVIQIIRSSQNTQIAKERLFEIRS